MNYALVKTADGFFGFVVRDGRLLATFLPQPKPTIEHAIQRDWPEAEESKTLMPRFRRAVADYYAGRSVRFSEAVDLAELPPFRRRVLEACRRIPYGKTASYGDLSRAVGSPGGARAVGGAMASNPLPLVIPCHRVLRSDGTLGGFSSPSGVRQKKRMLALEGALIR